MADPFAAQAEPAAPATPPAPSISPEIEALIAQRVQALTDTRVSGLQSMFDKKIAEKDKAYQQEIQKLRKYIPDYEDDEPVQDSETSRRLAELERENAILRASQQHPQGTARYQELMRFETAEEQIAYLEQLAAQAAPPPTPPPPAPTPDQDVEVPDIDPNRPPVRSFGWREGVPMTEALADEILSAFR